MKTALSSTRSKPLQRFPSKIQIKCGMQWQCRHHPLILHFLQISHKNAPDSVLSSPTNLDYSSVRGSGETREVQQYTCKKLWKSFFCLSPWNGDYNHLAGSWLVATIEMYHWDLHVSLKSQTKRGLKKGGGGEGGCKSVTYKAPLQGPHNGAIMYSKKKKRERKRHLINISTITLFWICLFAVWLFS